MRRFERFAFVFGIMNLVLGALSLFSPFVVEKPRGIRRYLPRQKRGLINNRSGMLLGQLGATNPPHTVMHSALGAAGLASHSLGRFSRPYLFISAALFAIMAFMGWSSFGTKPGIHKVNGFALDVRDNIFHSVLAAAALFMAVIPSFRREERPSYEEGIDLAATGLTE